MLNKIQGNCSLSISKVISTIASQISNNKNHWSASRWLLCKVANSVIHHCHQLHFNSHFQGQLGLAGKPQFSSCTYSRRQPLKVMATSFFADQMPSSNHSKGVKTLNETKISNCKLASTFLQPSSKSHQNRHFSLLLALSANCLQNNL